MKRSKGLNEVVRGPQSDLRRSEAHISAPVIELKSKRNTQHPSISSNSNSLMPNVKYKTVTLFSDLITKY